MNRLETLIDEYHGEIDFEEKPMVIDGLYSGGVCWYKEENPYFKKLCVVCEEVAHHLYSVGDILNQKDTSNAKQERVARSWAYKRLAPVERIKEALNAGNVEAWQIAEYLELDVAFIAEAVEYYKSKELL